VWARIRLAVGRARTRATPTPATAPEVALGAQPLPVNCIVFSKDRAMQLDACLRSIESWAPYAGPITVVYKATTPEFSAAYHSLDLADGVRLVAESNDFRSDVIAVLDPGSEHTVFHTDDDVFFRAPPGAPSVPSGFAAFSLRLGQNTTHCYTLGRPQRIPATVADGSVIAWDWTRAEDDFSYPLSLDGHVLPTRLLLLMLSRARFANPNELEEELHFRRYLAPRMMLAFQESCLVSIPANVVSSTHQNLAGGNPEWTPHALNLRFLAGERIDLEAMDFSTVRGAHQEIPLVFKRVSGG
jgi:hypothetical protein